LKTTSHILTEFYTVMHLTSFYKSNKVVIIDLNLSVTAMSLNAIFVA